MILLQVIYNINQLSCHTPIPFVIHPINLTDDFLVLSLIKKKKTKNSQTLGHSFTKEADIALES